MRGSARLTSPKVLIPSVWTIGLRVAMEDIRITRFSWVLVEVGQYSMSSKHVCVHIPALLCAS